MATLGELQIWVSKRLQDPNNTAVSSSDVADLINQAVRYWKNRRFSFNEVSDVTILTEGNPSVPLPADWLVPSIDPAFVIEYSGIRYPLQKVSEQDYNAMYLSNGIGQPFWFARQANTGYQVYPIPDRDYVLRRFYLKDYLPLANSGDSNDWTVIAEDVIKYTAAAYGSRDFRQDLTMYAEFMKQANDEYQNLLVTARKDNATGRVSIYSNL